MATGADLSILVIDDNEVVLNTMLKMFETVKYRGANSATDAESALKRMQQKNYDLIIADIELGVGKMNGLELLKEIRTGRAGIDKKTPVLILTSYSEINILGTAIALDASSFLAKPVRLEDLVRKIQEALNARIHIRQSIAYDVIATDLIAPSGEIPLKEGN